MELSRYYQTLMPQAFSKAPRLESKKHIDFVKRRFCVATGKPNPDAHHVQLRSRGTNDYTAIPLDHAVHMELHSRGEALFEAKYGVDLKDALIATLIERVAELEGRKR